MRCQKIGRHLVIIQFARKMLRLVLKTLKSSLTKVLIVQKSQQMKFLFLFFASSVLVSAVYFLFISINYSSVWPDIWKCAIVEAVHKSRNEKSATNYRLISKLSKLSLIFERLLLNHIYKKVRSKIFKKQHGFRPGRSTITQLIDFV